MSCLCDGNNDLWQQEATLLASDNQHGFLTKTHNYNPDCAQPTRDCTTPRFHVIFNDWFVTVPASIDNLLSFNADSWKQLFRNSTYQYILDDEDQELLIVEIENYEREKDVFCNNSALQQPLTKQHHLLAPLPV